MLPKTAVCRNLFSTQTTNVAYFQRKIQLSGFCAYPDGSPSQLIRISGVLLYLIFSNVPARKNSVFQNLHGSCLL